MPRVEHECKEEIAKNRNENVTNNHNETVEISGTHKGERRPREFNTHKTQ